MEILLQPINFVRDLHLVKIVRLQGKSKPINFEDNLQKYLQIHLKPEAEFQSNC